MVKVIFASDDGDSLIIEILGINCPGSNGYFTGNWLDGKIIFSIGSFGGEIASQFHADEFHRFLPEGEKLYKSLNGTAEYNSMGDCLNMKIIGDGRGHIMIEGSLLGPEEGYNKLHFEIYSDQTCLKSTLEDIRKLCLKYPVLGE